MYKLFGVCNLVMSGLYTSLIGHTACNCQKSRDGCSMHQSPASRKRIPEDEPQDHYNVRVMTKKLASHPFQTYKVLGCNTDSKMTSTFFITVKRLSKSYQQGEGEGGRTSKRKYDHKRDR